jgi:hypothetical protein
MRIIIWDMDWFYKTKFVPNFKAQKLASYHKQRYDLVTFVEHDLDLTFEYDILYILRESKLSPWPAAKYLDKPQVKLIGKEFQFYDNIYTLPMEIKMVRPDYSLYPVSERNSYANAHIIQLLHENKFLPNKQDPTNTVAKYRQKSLIVDEQIWELSDSDLQRYFKEITKLHDVAFLHPISIKRILQPEFWPYFKKLKFLNGTLFKFKNDYGSDFEQVKIILDAMYELKQLQPSIKLTGFPVKAILYDHWHDPANGIKDLKRLLLIMDYAKSLALKIHIKTPQNRHLTPYWHFFDMMETWSQNSPYLSYIEMMTYSLSERTGLAWNIIINESEKWSVPRVDFLLHIMTKYPETIPYMLRKWENTFIDINHINFNRVVKFVYNFERKRTLKEINDIALRGGME